MRVKLAHAAEYKSSCTRTQTGDDRELQKGQYRHSLKVHLETEQKRTTTDADNLV